MARGQTFAQAKERQATAVSDGVATTPRTFLAELDLLPRQIGAALPDDVSADRFLRGVRTCWRMDPKLQACTPASLIGAVMSSAQLGLELTPELGQAFLVPFVNRRLGVTEATLMIGYPGLVKLALQSGAVKIVEGREIRANDDFQFVLGTEQFARHTWDLAQERGEVIGYYAVAQMTDGTNVFHEPWSVAEILRHRDKFAKRTDDRSVWAQHLDAMAKKTMVRMLCGRLPQAAALERANRVDGVVRRHEITDRVAALDEVAASVDFDVEPEDAPVVELADEDPGRSEGEDDASHG